MTVSNDSNELKFATYPLAAVPSSGKSRLADQGGTSHGNCFSTLGNLPKRVVSPGRFEVRCHVINMGTLASRFQCYFKQPRPSLSRYPNVTGGWVAGDPIQHIVRAPALTVFGCLVFFS